MKKDSDKRIIRHIPNALTLARLVMTVVFLVIILLAPARGEKPAAFLMIGFSLFVVAGLTDIVDGVVARWFDVTSKLGRTLDPLADKVLVCGAFFCFAIVRQPKLANFQLSPITLALIHWGVFVILTAREILVQTLRQVAESRGVNFGAVWSGKLKMFLQSFGIGTVMVGWAFVSRTWGDWFTIITYGIMAAITVLSGIQSLQRPIKPYSDKIQT
jgi:CDP-diacylglycerol--glycerol-3-phosphate 3-phosphatidyltransferase